MTSGIPSGLPDPVRDAAAAGVVDAARGPTLRVSIGQHADPGRKAVQQDFHGVRVPPEALRSSKGIVVALADGIGSSDVSQQASAFAVRALLEDYYCTSEAWSVKTAAQRVLAATNSWLYAQTRQSPHRFERDRGYVCTLSALVLKGGMAHVLHVGDTRIYRLAGESLEQLTEDHRIRVSSEESYLARALGADHGLEIDYQALPLQQGDVFVLATDGVYEHVEPRMVAQMLQDPGADLDAVARLIVEEALQRGSPDNLSVQIVRIEALPRHDDSGIPPGLAGLPHPPMLAPRALLDGWRIVRELHHSHRSHLYLAVDEASGERAVIKTLATDLQADPGAVERFLLEEWVARRLDNAHVLKPCGLERPRTALYVVLEYVEGQTLEQWMRDHPRPGLATVRGFVEQIARGLQAFHRLEMVHQDLRPANVMIDATGTLKIIDFGSVRVAGLAEGVPLAEAGHMPGTPQYSAPELFLGEEGTARSDIFSLAVVAYELLAGRLPYGPAVARAHTRAAQARLQYRSVLEADGGDDSDIPSWVDEALRRALQPDARKRYAEPSEFVEDLRRPGRVALAGRRTPLIERNPLLFWKTVSSVLALSLLCLLAWLSLGQH